MSNYTAQGVTWNLTDLYDSMKDPKIEQDLAKGEELAKSFEITYKPIFETPPAAEKFPMGEMMEKLKELSILLTKPGVFSHLSFAAKTNDPAIGAFMQKMQVRLTNIQQHLIFFDVMWNKMDEALAEAIMNREDLLEYKHYLEHSRVYAPYTLKEGEEKVLSIKSNTGASAFSRLFDETINNIVFKIEEDGKEVEKNETEVLALFHSPDRDTRKRASLSLEEGLKRNSHVLTYIYNIILADMRSSMQIRGYKHPMTPRNMSNETDLESIQNLIASTKESYPIAHRYYELKKRMLGLDELMDYDRYAPISTDDAKISWDDCKKIVLEGYYAFSEKAGQVAERAFDENWIDAETREGKQGGGFCCSTTPDLHPYVLVNFTGSMRDVMTVAHELGHALHQHLAAERVGILESSAPLTMAETASVFGEMLIFEKILENEKDPKKRIGLLAGKIDDNFATVYRQIAMTDFELLAHETGLKDGELSSETLSDLWMKANGDFYGKSVTLTNAYRQGWKYIPHFVHSPFYCYAYAYAQLFVLTLYQKYKEDKEAFIPKYYEILSLGGSKKPEEIAGIMGLDIKEKSFWKGGFALLDEFVKQLESAASLTK